MAIAAMLGAWFSSAPAAVAVAAAALLAMARPRLSRPAVSLLVCVMIAVALRAARRVSSFETARAAVPMELGACVGTATPIEAPTLRHGSMRWKARVGAQCERGALDATAWLYGGPSDLARGDHVAIHARLGRLPRFFNDDDPRPRQARAEALASGRVDSFTPVSRSWSIVRAIDVLRARVRDRIESTFRSDVAPMARALMLGETDLDPEDDRAFRASGLSHLLAVSGMHLVLVVVVVVRALRWLLRRWTLLAAACDVDRIAHASGIGLAWAYAEFAGASGSAVRAAWMLGAACLARAVCRAPDATRALAASVLAMIAFDPLVVFDVSFLLSALATAGLVAWSKRSSLLRTWPRWIARAVAPLATTLAATIPCAPVLAAFSPTLPLGGVVANLVAVPIGEAFALPLCLAHAALGPWRGAERGCAAIASGALVLLREVAHAFASLACLQVPLVKPTPLEFAGLGIAAVAWLLARSWAMRFALLGCALTEWRAQEPPRGDLHVTFLDVGQGDAALVELPNGDALLIDAGGLVGTDLDIGERVIAPFLRSRRRSALLAVVVSHPHPDHFSGLRTGLTGVSVRELWDTGQAEREGTADGYRDIMAALRQQGTTVLGPERLCGTHERAGVRFDILWPCPDADPIRGPNDNSWVIRLSYGARSILFVGDAEHLAEEALLLAPEHLRADVLKVGHHGSRTSSSPEFIAAIHPKHAVISCGLHNRFGHPHSITLHTLADAHVHTWRTDEHGAIHLRTDGQTLEWHREDQLR